MTKDRKLAKNALAKGETDRAIALGILAVENQLARLEVEVREMKHEIHEGVGRMNDG